MKRFVKDGDRPWLPLQMSLNNWARHMTAAKVPISRFHFLSTIGRLQAEQQKQVQDFQEEVFERAKRAKEKAARESMEAQELIPKSTDAADVTPMAAGSQPTSSSNTPLNSYNRLSLNW
ncbi:hypothetical protein SAY86_015537 [Trapa natans]|uniref:Uncharacterized protein n=1 Tax=Trapa natans TaxID=22666 RepID=A0AAN7LI55_TRANT|nr:hypothetical protein SAY86_015537 [Trapa natans]